MICCDTCPFSPTCEEEDQFLADIGLGEQWGEEYETLQAEHLAAADLDPDWPRTPDN